VLLSHNPLNFDRLKGASPILVLAGDTHGGQVPLPGWLYGLLGYEKNARYNQGVFRADGNAMYVSRGLGTSHLPMRILRSPEIAVYRIEKLFLVREKLASPVTFYVDHIRLLR